MTTDQVVGLIRQLLPFMGGLLTAFGFSREDSSSLIANISEILGPSATIIGLIWSYEANSKKSILESASKMPEVQQVQLTKEAHKLAATLPDNVIVRGQRKEDQK